jgi:hypothetical protein
MKSSREFVRAAALFCLIAQVLVVAQAADRMATGQWELATTTKGETQVMKFCADPATLAIANGDARSGREALVKLHAASGCKVTDFKADAAMVSYSLTCPDRTVQASETYTGAAYEGVLRTKLASGALDVSNYKGRRLGPC